MDLRLLLLMVIAGIGFGVLAIHLLGGGTKRSILADAETVKERFHLDYPEIEIGEICFTEDRGTAFFPLKGLGAGLVHSVGDRFLTRCLAGSDVLALVEKGNTELILHMKDFTWPKVKLVFTDATDRKKVKDWLYVPSYEGKLHE